MADVPTTVSRRHRLLALFCAALVFVLGLFAASPALHRQLYHATHGPADDGCAVTLFASGVSVPIAVQAMPPPAAEWERPTFPPMTDLCLAAPHYQLLPGRGPPSPTFA